MIRILYKCLLLVILLSGICFGATPDNVFKKHNSMLYNPLSHGLNEYSVKVDLPDFVKHLRKTSAIDKGERLSVRMHWRKPNKRGVEVLGVDGKGHILDSLKRSFQNKFELIVPRSLESYYEGYSKRVIKESDGEVLIEAKDPTARKVIQRFVFKFGANGLIKQVKIYRPSGVETREYSYQKRSEAGNKYVASMVKATVLGAGFRTVTEYKLSYIKTSGFYVPAKMESSTKLIPSQKKGVEKEISETLIFSDYFINKDRARKWFNSKS